MSERKMLNTSGFSNSAITPRHKQSTFGALDHKITIEHTASTTASAFAPGKIYTKTSPWKPTTLINSVSPKRVTSLNRQIREIFKSPKRSDKDALFMLKYLGHIAFLNDFSNMNPELNAQEALIHVCRHLGYERHHAGEVIFQEGDESNGKMYIIFNGAVTVVKKDVEEVGNFEESITNQGGAPNLKIPGFFSATERRGSIRGDGKTPKNLWKKVKPVVNIAGLKKNMAGSRRDSFDSNFSAFETEDHFEEQTATRVSELAGIYGTIIDEILAGGFFGEKALISKIPRTATIITSKETEFLTLTQDLFQFVKSRFEKSNSQKLNFILDYFPIMDQLGDRKLLNSLTYLLEERRFKTYDEIVRQGKEGKDFYIVFEGECVIYKEEEISNKGKNVPKLFSKGAPRKCTPICNLQPGSFFGEEILFGKEIYNYTVKAASSNVVVFGLKKKKFELRFPKGASDQLLKLYCEKNEHYMNMLELKHENLQRFEQPSSPVTNHVVLDPELQANHKSKIGEITRGIFMPSFTAYKDPEVLRSTESLPFYPKLDENLPFMKLSSPENDIFHEATIKDLHHNKFDFGTEDGPKLDRNPSNDSKVERLIQAKYLGNSYGTNERKLHSTSPSPVSRKDVFLGTTLSQKLKKMKMKDKKFNPSVTVMQSTHLYFNSRGSKTAYAHRRIDLASPVEPKRHLTTAPKIIAPKMDFDYGTPKIEFGPYSPRVDLASTTIKTEMGTGKSDLMRLENDSYSIRDKDISYFQNDSPRMMDHAETEGQEFERPEFEQEFWRKTLKSGNLGVAKKKVYNNILKISKNNNKLLEAADTKSSFYDTISSRNSSFPEITKPSNYSIEVGFLAGLKSVKSKFK